MTDYCTGRHCVFLLHAHLVFTPKYRRNVFKKEHLEEMREIFSYICEGNDVILKEFNGEADHIHLLINFPPHVQISKLVNSLKGVSSRVLRKKYADIRGMCFKDVLWSRSYFAGSVGGASIETLKRYIEGQNAPD